MCAIHANWALVTGCSRNNVGPVGWLTDIAILPVGEKMSPSQPDYRVVSQGTEISRLGSGRQCWARQTRDLRSQRYLPTWRPPRVRARENRRHGGRVVYHRHELLACSEQRRVRTESEKMPRRLKDRSRAAHRLSRVPTSRRLSARCGIPHARGKCPKWQSGHRDGGDTMRRRARWMGRALLGPSFQPNFWRTSPSRR